MSELKIDNPPQRLLDILESGRAHSGHLNCRDVWKKILDVKLNDEQLLLYRLAKALELSGRIIKVRENHYSSLWGNSNHWKNCVEKAFMAQSLNNTWQSFIQHIDIHTINELAMLSDLFESRGRTQLCKMMRLKISSNGLLNSVLKYAFQISQRR